MTITVERAPDPAEPQASPGRARRALRLSELTRTDRALRAVLAVAAVIPTLALAFLAYQMVKQAYPAMVFNGWHFFTSSAFNLGNGGYSSAVETHHGYTAPAGSSFGVLALLFGTLVSSVIALILAVPVSLGGALLLVEKLPERLQSPLGIFLELLAGIPSVVYGLWGYYTLGPFLSHNVFQWIADLGLPWFSGTPKARGLLSASVVLAVMIIPIIASTSRELIRSVPAVAKEGAAALGLTSAETVRFVTIPYIRTGVIAASILGWARALGETIAVLIISNNTVAVPHSAFDPFLSMAASIAQLLDSALTEPMALHSLAEVGLVLLVITLLTNFGGRLLAHRFSATGLPVGRGV